MAAYQKIIVLLEENNSMLKEILAILRKFDSGEYQSQEDIKQLMINITANAAYDLLKNNKDFRDKLRKNLKL